MEKMTLRDIEAQNGKEKRKNCTAAAILFLKAARFMIDSGEKNFKVISDKFGILSPDGKNRNIKNAKKVITKCIPEIVEAVEKGKMTLTSAYDASFCSIDEQKEIINKKFGQHKIKYLRKMQRNAKELNQNKINKILELTAKITSCVDVGGFVSNYNVVLQIKELENYCNSLKNDNEKFKRKRSKGKVCVVDYVE